MAEQNLYVNQLLSDPVYFADLLSGLLFAGRQMVAAGDLPPAKDQSGILYADRSGRRKALEHFYALASGYFISPLKILQEFASIFLD